MQNVFKPGVKSPSSGVYRVMHARQHAPAHYVTVLYGDAFPLCKECSDGVTFELAMAAVHVNAHAYFDCRQGPPAGM
jgi:hypothetical protein